ncbi:MAG: hypothetical protein C0410_01705 [Anaerolinea sp.]|nr:hypothetical protein [Anaerolinea sp.]
MSLLSELTLIVPSFERPRYALRQMRYWSGSSVTLHVLDGSRTPIDTEALKIMEGNIHYHHMPISFARRLAQAPNLVNTFYTSLLGDDEFFIPNALENCIEELNKDETLVACIGRCLSFRVVDQAIKGKPWDNDFKNYELSSDSARERVIAHMNPYRCSTIYAVTKSEVWKNNIRVYGLKEYSSDNVYEIAYEIACAYQGKSKVIDTLMWLRSGENPAHPQMSVREWYNNKNYKEEVEEFFNTVITVLRSDEGPTKFEIRRILEDAVATYLTWDEKTVKKKNPLFLILLFIHSLLPGILLEIYRKLKPLKKTPEMVIDRLPIIEMAEQWKKQGAIVDLDELRRIKKILETFHFA